MEFQRVSKKAKKKWIFSRVIALIFAVVPSAAFLLFFGDLMCEDEPTRLPFYVSAVFAAALVVFHIASIIIYPPIEYIQWQYMIADDRIEIKKGIFYRSHTVIPISRIQHVTVTQGVLQRPFKLSTVQIHTAGSIMEIQELDTEVAEDICGRLQKRVNVKVMEKQAAEGEN